MKRLFYIGLLASCFIFNSCFLRKPTHNIRVINNYNVALHLVEIGLVSYGTIINGGYTDYKYIDEGSHSISGYSSLGEALSGSITVLGRGKHNWSVEITSSGDLNLKKDK